MRAGRLGLVLLGLGCSLGAGAQDSEAMGEVVPLVFDWPEELHAQVKLRVKASDELGPSRQKWKGKATCTLSARADEAGWLVHRRCTVHRLTARGPDLPPEPVHDRFERLRTPASFRIDTHGRVAEAGPEGVHGLEAGEAERIGEDLRGLWSQAVGSWIDVRQPAGGLMILPLRDDAGTPIGLIGVSLQERRPCGRGGPGRDCVGIFSETDFDLGLAAELGAAAVAARGGPDQVEGAGLVRLREVRLEPLRLVPWRYDETEIQQVLLGAEGEERRLERTVEQHLDFRWE